MLAIPELMLLAAVAWFLAVPLVWGWRLVFLFLFTEADSPVADADLPRAAVILPLRGADPSLRACLRGLLNQDYPRFSLHIVVDSRADPAWDLVHEVLAEGRGAATEVHVDTLRQPCATCTLKISSLIQAVAGLDKSVQVIAMIDGDAIPPRTWLRSLVAPLADERVGAVTGIQWFAPRHSTWGALVRQMWNAGALAQMYAFGHPWGGTLALRARLFRRDNLLGELRESFCDDSRAADLLRRLRLKVRFLPALTMVNRETIDLRGSCRFIRRQLLNPRLDFRPWPLLLGVNVGNALALTAAGVMMIVGLATGHLSWVWWFGPALGIYFGGMMSGLFILQRRIRVIVRRRGQALPPASSYLKSLIAAVLAHVINTGCLVAAMAARRIRWRGVEYTLAGPRRIRLAEYHPFPARHSLSRADRSII
jgi:hypothetical protein